MAAQHSWGVESRAKIGTLKRPWPEMLDEILLASPFDLTVVWAHRGQLAQNRAYAEGTSTKQWPDSLHNAEPTRAVDLAPYINGAIDWGRQDHGRRYYIMAGIVLGIARWFPEIYVRWGGDWDRDGDLDDQSLMDLGHFEIHEREEEDTAP